MEFRDKTYLSLSVLEEIGTAWKCPFSHFWTRKGKGQQRGCNSDSLFSALSRGKFHFLLIQPNFPLGQVIQLGQGYAAATPHMQLPLKTKSKVQINGRNGKNVAKQY